MENSIAMFDEAPELLRRVSHLHRLDESRHQATALKLSKLSQEILEQTKLGVETTLQTCHPQCLVENRMLEARIRFWKLALFDGAIFANIPLEDKTAFFNHICRQATKNSLSLHPRQVTMTQQVTKRAVTESGLSPEFKQIFVDVLRNDPIHRNLVEAIDF